ncbi:MAG: HEAT repeat domain-containing protein [Actinomycetota bacterium]
MSEPGTSTSRPAPEASERSARERSVVALLRQLWLGLASYRLYPENPNRPGFDEAVDRIGRAAAEALAGGAVDLEIRGDRFVLGTGLLAHEDSLGRLALVCFERRVERLTVTAIPNRNDLERLYATLARSPADLEDAGGVEQAMADTGVTTVSLSHIGPGAVDEADHVPADLASGPDSRRAGIDVLASELMVEDLHGSPEDQAETLLARLREVMEEGQPDPESRLDVHAAAHDMLTELPTDVRRSMVQMLVDRAHEDPVAGRLIGTMSNAELTRALVDAGSSGGRDPVELARQLTTAGVRQVDIVDLTRALAAGHEDAGTIIAGLEQLGVDLSGDGALAAGGSVLEVLSQYLSATRGDDVRSIQDAVAAPPEDLRAAQVLAVGDYIALETDLERAGEVLGIWSDELRHALRERDERAVVALLQPVRDVLLGGDEGRPELFEAYVRRALTREVVFDAVSAEAADGHPHLAAMLGPFGDDGVEVLLDLLADEDDRQRRALLLGALRRITPAHPGPVIDRLRDERWFVVRNAVSILGTAGGAASVPRLAEVARHPAAEVRREVPEALANAGGPAAVPSLVRIAVEGAEDVRAPAVTSLGTLVGAQAAAGLAEVAARAPDRAIAQQAVEALAARPGDRDVLRELVARARETRLPRRTRRFARKALARAERAGG